MAKKFIKPALPDLIVLDPKFMKPLAVDGEWKEGIYWVRRLAGGDVIVVTPPAEPVPTPVATNGAAK